MKILCILANPKPVQESYSKRAGMEFIKEYKIQNPTHEVEIMDLYEKGQEHLSYETLSNAINNRSGKMCEEATYFSEFDKYIVCAPMWNLTTPSILKSYIDHIVAKGVTFKYSSNGIPKGLLKDKKAIYIGSRGGAYPFPLSLIAWDERYVRFIFRFMGIKNFKKIMFENTDKDPVKAKEKFPEFLNKVKSLSKSF
ncbi:MAG: FMN-dependent NADH-azoreductase [Cetobacterium sp.]|uniref:FMN-dependent NADH-azoreductase n=1 Tax=Cetobacterium sp. TaxID=2071632 RepID=UPI003EE7993B